MSSELMKYIQGTIEVPKQDREVVRQAKKIHDKVRLSAVEADAAGALAGHIMEGVVAIDDHRRMLAGDDPVKTALLADIEQEYINSVKRIQRDLTSGWNL